MEVLKNNDSTKDYERMKSKYRITIAILLVIVAIVALIYNLFVQKEILYIASAIAVCGTILILVKEIVQSKNNK